MTSNMPYIVIVIESFNHSNYGDSSYLGYSGSITKR